MIMMDYGDIVVWTGGGSQLFQNVSVHTFIDEKLIQIRRRKIGTTGKDKGEETVAVFSIYTVQSITRPGKYHDSK